MSTIHFTATPFTIGNVSIVHLPKDASAKLPSRGMSMAKGTLNGSPVTFPLEPDGKGSHWFTLEKSTKKPVTVQMEPLKVWPEPAVPADIKKGIATVPKAQALWNEITPMARWDWIRWIRSTNNPETRKKNRGGLLETHKRHAKTLLFQPQYVYRTVCLKDRRASRSNERVTDTHFRLRASILRLCTVSLRPNSVFSARSERRPRFRIFWILSP